MAKAAPLDPATARQPPQLLILAEPLLREGLLRLLDTTGPESATPSYRLVTELAALQGGRSC